MCQSCWGQGQGLLGHPLVSSRPSDEKGLAAPQGHLLTYMIIKGRELITISINYGDGSQQ